MALRGLKLFRTVRAVNVMHRRVISTNTTRPNDGKVNKLKEYKTESNFVYLDDPDQFGTLSPQTAAVDYDLEDEGDRKEQEFTETRPLPYQQLTPKQYSDLIKQYLKHKRLKEATDVLEVRMLKEDRVKPNNYIYNILIGACADAGYTKKAFKLYNDMKRRALKVTGDTYTCLFEACSKSPWALDGLKNAGHLRNLMIEKGIEPNLTNYNAMIKAFGRCGDLPTAFKIVDEMVAKKIKIRVHTFNHLLQACISDKESGLRHALVVWRKMLKMREKPNIYTFNLMLKCVKECNLGAKEDIEELIRIIQEETPLAIKNIRKVEILSIEAPNENASSNGERLETLPNAAMSQHDALETQHLHSSSMELQNNASVTNTCEETTQLTNINLPVNTEVSLQFVEKMPAKRTDERTVPNLLSKKIRMEQVLALQEVETIQDRFAIIGGQEDFLKEMQVYSVKPDIKTFTQMVFLIENCTEAESKLIETMNTENIKADIDFFNMLIKKRCLRCDYENAFKVIDMIEEEIKQRKKKHFLKKKLRLKPNVMTYGVLAMACNTKESAEQLLQQMKESQLRVNIEILGTLLRHGTAHNKFDYITYIMNIVKEENVQVNEMFLKHLENFNDKCVHILRYDESDLILEFAKSYKKFRMFYKKWLQEVNVDEVLEPKHPWRQFQETYPDTLQRSDVKIVEPKRFYKRSKKYIKYVAQL